MSCMHVLIKFVLQDENRSTNMKRQQMPDFEQTTMETAQRSKKSKTKHDDGDRDVEIPDLDSHDDGSATSSSSAGED